LHDSSKKKGDYEYIYDLTCVCVDSHVIYFVYNIGICLFILCTPDDIGIMFSCCLIITLLCIYAIQIDVHCFVIYMNVLLLFHYFFVLLNRYADGNAVGVALPGDPSQGHVRPSA
jgi:hypothetical protein